MYFAVTLIPAHAVCKILSTMYFAMGILLDEVDEQICGWVLLRGVWGVGPPPIKEQSARAVVIFLRLGDIFVALQNARERERGDFCTKMGVSPTS